MQITSSLKRVEYIFVLFCVYFSNSESIFGCKFEGCLSFHAKLYKFEVKFYIIVWEKSIKNDGKLVIFVYWNLGIP